MPTCLEVLNEVATPENRDPHKGTLVEVVHDWCSIEEYMLCDFSMVEDVKKINCCKFLHFLQTPNTTILKGLKQIMT